MPSPTPKIANYCFILLVGEMVYHGGNQVALMAITCLPDLTWTLST